MKKNATRIFCTLLLTVSMFHLTTAQDFTWVKGPSVSNQLPVYGILGVSSSLNNPGARMSAMRWKDASGNFWLFGGLGFDNFGNSAVLNDLWSYNPLNNEWKWVNGDSMITRPGNYGTITIPSATNKPGARMGGSTWTDAAGDFWMLGGSGIDATGAPGDLNDLWKYNVTTNQWTWMKGSNTTAQVATYGSLGVSAPGNTPGSGSLGQTWTDATGNLWFFGGNGQDAGTVVGFLQDLWRYSPSNNQWTWMNGSGTVAQVGTYGTQGVPASGNQPGGRFMPMGWADANGNLWMFGGYGYASSNLTTDVLDDMWKYNIASNQWAWVRGSNNLAQVGSYGLMNNTSSLDNPGCRYAATMWQDASSNVWMFGGHGVGNSSTSFPDNMSDLWRFDPATFNWTWVKGSPAQNQPGTYGTFSVTSPLNIPGARFRSSGWVDASNQLWLFGGEGQDAVNALGYLNDMWKLNMCVAPTLTFASTNTVICGAGNATVTATGAATYSWSSQQTGSVVVLNPSSNTNYTIYSIDASGCYGAGTYTQLVGTAPTVAVSSNTNGVCPGTAISLTVTGASSYSWSTTQTGSVIVVSPSVTTQYTVQGMNAGCTGTISYISNVLNPPVLQISSSSNPICEGEVATLSVSGTNSYSWHTTPGSNANSYTVNPLVNTTYSVTGTDLNGCETTDGIVQNVSGCVGLSENKSSKKTIMIYPNPNNGEFRVKGVERGILVIMNSLGQNVYEKEVNTSEPIKTELSKGIYYYKLITEDVNSSTGKMVVE